MPRSSFLHAGGLGFGDVLVVGLVLQFPAEVLDCFIQAFFQWHLQTHKTKIVRWVRQVEGGGGGAGTRLGWDWSPRPPEEPIKKNLT